MRPESIEEARKLRYATWAGNPKGYAYKEGYCVIEVWPGRSRGWIPYQCRRKNGNGPDGLYCKQHAKRGL